MVVFVNVLQHPACLSGLRCLSWMQPCGRAAPCRLQLLSNSRIQVKDCVKECKWHVVLYLVFHRAGVMGIDEGIELASLVTGGNDRSMLLALEPQYHSSTEKHSVVKHRRLLEDKVIASLAKITVLRVCCICARVTERGSL